MGLGANSASPDAVAVNMKEESLEAKQKDDPWALPEFTTNEKPWKKLTGSEKIKRVAFYILKLVLFLGFLYLFICSLDFLSSAFRLLGGKAAGQAFQQSEILSNPVTGLMLGILSTVLVQSSSTSTSIVVTMVANEVIPVKEAIPIIMGANIGTSVTNTIVAMGQLGKKDDFRRAFAGATVHDIFNWLCVFILLTVEVVTDAIAGQGYLFAISNAMIESMHIETSEAGKTKLLKAITEPFTKKVVQVDKKVIYNVALNDEVAAKASVLKKNCEENRLEWLQCDPMPSVNNGTACPDAFVYSNQTGIPSINGTSISNGTSWLNGTLYTNGEFLTEATVVHKYKCDYLFALWELGDVAWGIILLIISLFLLIVCLIAIVKVLHSLLKGSLAKVVRKTVNYECPGKASFLAGYMSILVGVGLTMAVQSSSIFTSAITPLVGVGVISLDRMYPMTLGSNVGTTFTAILASLANSGAKLHLALQVALCHLFFNITGILIWYPIPQMRKIPISIAKILGNTTAEYRWFAIFYLIVMFLLLPGFFFGISLAGSIAFFVAFAVVLFVFFTIVFINVIQRKKPSCLHPKLRNWNFLPLWLHSLDPLDRVFTGCCARSRCCRERCGVKDKTVSNANKDNILPSVVTTDNDNKAYVGSQLAVQS